MPRNLAEKALNKLIIIGVEREVPDVVVVLCAVSSGWEMLGILA